LKEVVVDASVALAWCFPDEGNEYANSVLNALEGWTIFVPAIWGLEIANALLSGERSRRLRQPEIQRFTTLIENLPLFQDVQTVRAHVTNVLPLARDYRLSAYDAAYLELAIRHGTPLATLDGSLKRAAYKTGVAIFAADAD